ncbi:Hypothetical predicted protein, partial [Olea europaea subsp. europaea]
SGHPAGGRGGGAKSEVTRAARLILRRRLCFTPGRAENCALAAVPLLAPLPRQALDPSEALGPRVCPNECRPGALAASRPIRSRPRRPLAEMIIARRPRRSGGRAWVTSARRPGPRSAHSSCQGASLLFNVAVRPSVRPSACPSACPSAGRSADGRRNANARDLGGRAGAPRREPRGRVSCLSWAAKWAKVCIRAAGGGQGCPGWSSLPVDEFGTATTTSGWPTSGPGRRASNPILPPGGRRSNRACVTLSLSLSRRALRKTIRRANLFFPAQLGRATRNAS